MIESSHNSVLRRVILCLYTLVCLLSLPSTGFAFGVNDCAATRFGSDLVCTAADVSITGIAIVPGGPTKCVGGIPITLDLDVNVNFATPARWDIGLFLSNDGKSPEKRPASGGASSCTVAVLDTPTINPATAFLDLDPIGGADTCGDGNGSIGGGTGSGVQRIYGVPVACQAVDLSGGRLFIPFLTSWDNQSSPSGSTCTSNLDPVPNTKSKCNVPNGTVQADVLKSTVALVVLPTISKTDGITRITAGDSTTYTVVITNTTGAPLSNAIFRDIAVANLTVNSLSCSAAGGATCPASSAIATMQGGGITLPPMPVNSTLTFSMGTTVSSSAPAGPLANIAEVIVDAESNAATDTNTVIKKLDVTKAFAPSSIVANGETTLSITLQNSNLAAATGVAFTDIYPANLINAAIPGVTNTCSGTVTAAAGSNSLVLSGGTIPAAGGSCTITVQVTSSVAGAYTNNTGTVTSAEGYTGNSASASLAVGVSNFSTSTKSLLDLNGGEPDPGEVIRYTITLNETAGVIATGISISDTLSSALTNLSVFSCPSGATCGFSGQTLSATGITVPANGSVSVIIDGTITGSTAAGTTINNCADISNPSGIGASPCASTIIVSPSAVAGAGNKRLYLYDATATPAYKLSRVIPTSASSVTIAQSTNRTWALSPTLATPMTISPDVTPLAIIPVNLYLTSNTANQNRTVRVDVTCSGGGTTYSESKIFDGTAVNNPYLPTGIPTLVSFNKLTISANHFCGAGQTWNLTVANTGSGSVIVHPVSGVNNSFISLPSLNIINVDSVNSYDAAYAAVTTPANGYFGGGQTVYIRSVVSDPFGSFDITSATVTIKNPYGTTVVSAAAMTVVADSGSATKTFEYQYTVPTSGPAGIWTTIVKAQEGTEGTISDDGTGVFKLGIPNLLVLKSVSAYSDPINGIGAGAKAIPGAFMTYTITVTNFGYGAVDADTTVITDPIPANTELFVGDINVAGSGPVLFTDGAGATASGLSYTFTSLSDTGDNLEFSGDSGISYDKIPNADPVTGGDSTVTNIRIPLDGTFNGSDGTNNPTFNIKFRVRIE